MKSADLTSLPYRGSADLATLLAALERVVEEISSREALALLAALEQLKAIVWTRLLAAPRGNDHQENPPEGDRLLTVPEVAGLLNVPKGYVYDLARRGEIPVVRFGKYVRVRCYDLREWVAQRREKVFAPSSSRTYTPQREFNAKSRA